MIIEAAFLSYTWGSMFYASFCVIHSRSADYAQFHYYLKKQKRLKKEKEKKASSTLKH